MYWDWAYHIFMIYMIKHKNPTRFWSAWVWGVLSVGRQVPGWGGRGGIEEGVERGLQVTMDGEEMSNITTMTKWPCSQIWMIIYWCGWWYSCAGSTTRIAWVSSLQVGALIKTLLYQTSKSLEIWKIHSDLFADTLKEILRELDNKLTEDDINNIIEEVDEDGSGTLDFDGTQFYDGSRSNFK